MPQMLFTLAITDPTPDAQGQVGFTLAWHGHREDLGRNGVRTQAFRAKLHPHLVRMMDDGARIEPVTNDQHAREAVTRAAAELRRINRISWRRP